MMSTRSIAYGGHGPPDSRGGIWRLRVGVLLLAVAALGLEGCSSLGLNCGRSDCEPTGGLLRNNRLTRLFRRDVIVTNGGYMGEPALGAPIVAAPAPVLTMPGATISPAPSLAPLPAPGDEAPMRLEPVPSTGSESAIPGTEKTGANLLNRKTLYETRRPSGEITSSRREGPESAGTSDQAVQHPKLEDPLINLPPLSAVAQPAENVTPPVSPAAEAFVGSSRAQGGGASPKELLTLTTPAELPPRPVPQPLSLAEGVARFKVVEPQLAGGSLPTAPGWSFLVEKGYRAVLDLRPRAEVQPGDDAAAHHAGLRYVVLPVTPETLDERLLKQFDDEISFAANRPLYFFDTDGARAAVLWYLRLIVSGNLDEASAAKEVEELGPKDARLWLAATTFLNARRKPAVSENSPELTPPPAPELPALPRPVPRTTIVAPPGPLPSMDPTSWRPFAAMALTALSVPLAFASRSVFSHMVGSVSRRASLSGPGHAPRALPPSSDA